MARIPAEIDRLMWLVVEERSDRAVEEFVARHPEYRSELMRRLNLMDRFKGARTSAPIVSVPAFQRPTASPSRLHYALAPVALASVGLATFFAAQWYFESQAAHTPVRETPPVTVGAPSDRQPTYHMEPRDDAGTSEPPVVEPTPSDPAPSRPSDASVAERPIRLSVREAPLLDALQMIGEESRLRLTIAPMMPNPKIDLTVVDQRPMEVLEQLGAKYGFKAFEQEEGHVLIVPDQARHRPNEDAGGMTGTGFDR